MPINIEWHSNLPVLIVSYSGIVTAGEFRQLEQQRNAMLSERSEPVMLLADMREMERLADALAIQSSEPSFQYPNVSYILVVLSPRLYRVLLRAIEDTAEYDYPVRFFMEVDAALAAAETLIS